MQGILRNARRRRAHRPVRVHAAASGGRHGPARLRDHDSRLFTLTDNTLGFSGRQLENAEIIDVFERRFSVDETVHRHKPAPQAYASVGDALGVEAGACCLIACHLWDTIGALAVGWQAGLVLRTGHAPLDVGPSWATSATTSTPSPSNSSTAIPQEAHHAHHPHCHPRGQDPRLQARADGRDLGGHARGDRHRRGRPLHGDHRARRAPTAGFSTSSGAAWGCGSPKPSRMHDGTSEVASEVGRGSTSTAVLPADA